MAGLLYQGNLGLVLIVSLVESGSVDHYGGRVPYWM